MNEGFPPCGAGTGDAAPTFLSSCRKKSRRRSGGKERRFGVQIPPLAGLDEYGGRWCRCGGNWGAGTGVRLGFGGQRWCCPAFERLGGAFGGGRRKDLTSAPRLSPPKSRPSGRLAPICACGRSRFAQRWPIRGWQSGSGGKKKVKSDLHPFLAIPGRGRRTERFSKTERKWGGASPFPQFGETTR